MNTTCERPSWWFVPDYSPAQEAIEDMSDPQSRYFNEHFDWAAAHAYTWSFFLGGGGGWDALDGPEIKTHAPKYSDPSAYTALSLDELVVLLMDGDNQQTLWAKEALRERLKAEPSFEKWVARCAEADYKNRDDD